MDWKWILTTLIPIGTAIASWHASRAFLFRKMKSEKIVIGVIGQPKPELLLPYHTYTSARAARRSRYAICVLICRSLSYAFEHCDFVQIDVDDLSDPKLVAEEDLSLIGQRSVGVVGPIPHVLSHHNVRHYKTIVRCLKECESVWRACVTAEPMALCDELSLRGVLTLGPEEKLYE